MKYSSCFHKHCWLLVAMMMSLVPQGASFHSLRNAALSSPLHQHGLWATSVGTASTSPSDYSSVTNVTLLVPPYASSSSPLAYPSVLHYIHVESLLTDAETRNCWDLATSHGKDSGRWERPDSIRHATYATCDFAVEECATMEQYLQSIHFDRRVMTRLEARYGIPVHDMSYLDLFCAHYQGGATTNGGMDRLEAHRDGSILSFTITLTPPEMYQGGGTFFDALRDEPPDGVVLYHNGVVRPPRAGDCVLHCGKILHGADVVTSGERTVLVGFVEVASPWQRPGVLGEACRDFGRMDVAALRHNKQKIMTNNGKLRGWISRNNKWLSASGSHLRGFLPAFRATGKRANPEFQRCQKLVAEDQLLRNILMKEKPENFISLQALFEGEEISIL